MFIFTFSAIIIGLICWIIAFFTYLKKHDTLPAQNFIRLTFFVGLWLLANSCLDLAKSIQQVIFLNSVLTLAVCLIFTFFIFFVESLISPIKIIPRTKKIVFYGGTLIFVVFSFTRLGFYNIKIFLDKPVTEDLGIMWQAFLVFAVAVLIISFVKLIRHIRKSQGKTRLQAIYIFTGVLIGTLLGVIFDLILPILGETRFYNLGFQFVIFFIFCSLYAIYKHQLLDIKVVIQKGIIFTILLSLISGFYLLILFTILYFYPYTSPLTYLFAAIITTIIGIFSIPQLETFFKRITDKIFFKDKYSFSKAIDELSQIMNFNLESEVLFSELDAGLKKILKVKSVCFVITKQKKAYADRRLLNYQKSFEPNMVESSNHATALQKFFCADLTNFSEKRRQKLQQLAQLPFLSTYNLLIPIIFKHDFYGIIALGDKKSGEAFFPEDCDLLTTFSYQFGLALERSRLFEQLKDYSKTLEQKVDERTAEIKQLQENQAQMMFDISHELQTPLTVIKGELNVLEQQASDRQKLFPLEKSIDRVSSFVTKLLKLARLDFTNSPQIDLDFSDLVTELVEYFEVIAAQQNIAIQATIQPGLKLIGSKEQLDELLTNLLSNAMKYIDHERKIKIALSAAEKQISLTIKDTGIGMSPEDLKNLFHRFYRAQNDKKIKGTGLGLAICKKIIDIHNGTIDVESALGQGTTVTVKFPRTA